MHTSNKWKELSFYKQGLIIIAVVFILYNLSANINFMMNVINSFLRVITPVIIGCTMAYFLSRPVIYLEGVLNKSQTSFIRKRSQFFATIIIFLIVIIIVTIIISYVSPIIVGNLMDFIGNLPIYYNNAIDWARDLGSEHWLYSFLPEISDYNVDVATDIIDALAPTDVDAVIETGILGFMTSALGTIVSNIVSIGASLINFAMGLIIALYLLLYRSSVLALVDRIAIVFIKPETRKFLKTYLHKSNEVFYKFISAQFLDACILGTLALIVLALLRVEYALTLALLLGICNMIPFFGSIFASIVTTIVTIFTGGIFHALIVFSALLILQQIDANFINPKITGDVLGLNPLLIVISIFIGGAYLGILGMFIAVPVAAMCKIFLEDYLTMREKKLGIKKSFKK